MVGDNTIPGFHALDGANSGDMSHYQVPVRGDRLRRDRGEPVQRGGLRERRPVPEGLRDARGRKHDMNSHGDDPGPRYAARRTLGRGDRRGSGHRSPGGRRQRIGRGAQRVATQEGRAGLRGQSRHRQMPVVGGLPMPWARMPSSTACLVPSPNHDLPAAASSYLPSRTTATSRCTTIASEWSPTTRTACSLAGMLKRATPDGGWTLKDPEEVPARTARRVLRQPLHLSPIAGKQQDHSTRSTSSTTSTKTVRGRDVARRSGCSPSRC